MKYLNKKLVLIVKLKDLKILKLMIEYLNINSLNHIKDQLFFQHKNDLK